MIDVEDKAVWFPEPDGDDDWFKRKGETTFAWVSRATSEKGQECRRFLNENIATLPQGWQTKLHSDLRTRDWDSVFFEIAVARTLQILGASIEVEVPVASTNKRPDFVATFPDGVVAVEATAPEINQAMNTQNANNEDLNEIIESLIPDDWSVEVWGLPKLGPNDSKKGFKRKIRELFSELPPANTFTDDSIKIEIEAGFDGELSLVLRPGRNGRRAAFVRGVISGADNTQQRISAAVTRKKKQLKHVGTPVVLAVRTDAFGDMEDYDQALYGLTFESVDHQGRTIRTGFHPTGVFGKQRSSPPVCAAVLAYTAVGFPGVTDPVLYLHPAFTGQLPEALLKRLQVRSLEADGIRIAVAGSKRILDQMHFVRQKASAANE